MIETIPEDLTGLLLRAYRWRTPRLGQIERRPARQAERTISFSTEFRQLDAEIVGMIHEFKHDHAKYLADLIIHAGGTLTNELESELRQNPNRYAGLTPFEISPDRSRLIGALILKAEQAEAVD
jgi:hypothetical protein